MFFRCWTISLAWLLLLVLSGCDTLGHSSGGAATPAPQSPNAGGLLLHTGAIQLGSGLGQNAYSWQGGPGPSFISSKP